jgi:prophage regulatory protein
MQKEHYNDWVMRKPETIKTTGLSDPTIWRMEKQGRFPKRIQLGGNSVGWLASEIFAWIEERAIERGQ